MMFSDVIRYLTLMMVLMVGFVLPVHATVYTYTGSGSTKAVMYSYSAEWDDSNSNLSLTSKWTNPYGKKIDQVSFLINDGGIPDATKYTEQFLYYDLDLINNLIQVREYYGDGVLGTYKGLINTTSNSFDLKFDNSILGLNEKSFADQGRSFEPDLFGEQIGIWHYLYSDGVLEDTYDIHLADTDVHRAEKVDLPIPQTWILLSLGVVILQLSKSLERKTAEERSIDV